jgi:hypothetical protein
VTGAEVLTVLVDLTDSEKRVRFVCRVDGVVAEDDTRSLSGSWFS